MKAYCNCAEPNPCGHIGCPDCDETCEWDAWHDAEYEDDEDAAKW